MNRRNRIRRPRSLWSDVRDEASFWGRLLCCVVLAVASGAAVGAASFIALCGLLGALAAIPAALLGALAGWAMVTSLTSTL